MLDSPSSLIGAGRRRLALPVAWERVGSGYGLARRGASSGESAYHAGDVGMGPFQTPSKGEALSSRLVDLLGVAGEGGVTDVPSEQKDRHSRGSAGRKENILKASCPRKNLLRTVQKGAQKGAPSRKEKDPSRLLE